MALAHEIDDLSPEGRILTASLKAGRWVLASVGANFRAALLEVISSKSNQHFVNSVPTCFLASALYRGTRVPSIAETEGKKLPVVKITIVDSDAPLADDFWSEAVKVVAKDDAKLANLTELELSKISRAVETLLASLPELEAVFKFITHFVFFESEDWIGSSQPHFSGCIFLNKNILDSPSLLAETIVHELAHQEFFSLNLLDRIVLPEGDLVMKFAPFQNHDRPNIGRMHAAHALYRTFQYQKAVGSPDTNKSANCLFETLKTFSPEHFSKFGNFLINICYSNIISPTFSIREINMKGNNV